MRNLALLLAGAAVALSTQVAVSQLWERGPAADADEPVVVALATDAGVPDAAPPDAPSGLTMFPGTSMPPGVLMPVHDDVMFVAPSGFAAMQEATQLQLFVPGVQIAVSVSAGERLRAQQAPRQAIEAFAAHNGLAVASIRDHGANRLLAAMTGVGDDGSPQEAMLMMHVEPARRVTVIVRSQGDRVGDPAVMALVDEAFHSRLLMQ